MPSLNEVRRSNNLLKEARPGLVAVFAGATSGIGEATCKQFACLAPSPTIYIVGRSPTKGYKLVRELQLLNKEAKVSFIEADLTLLRSADKVLKVVREQETKVNLLFLTQGFLSLKGRQETSEGLDRMISLQYFSRIRLINNFLPLLHAVVGLELARVVSVLGAGNEGQIITDDIEITKDYSLKVASNQSITMMSLSMEELAVSHPDISFLHVYPGVVRGTGITLGLGRGIATLGHLVMATVARPFTIGLEESGERHLYAATSDDFAPERKRPHQSVFRLGSNGEPCAYNAVLGGYKTDGTQERVWDLTDKVLRRVAG